uniref:Cystatin domain-containing protein n=1 Tax=Syphacia muris TaxID=451379 RepID=A0A0N5AHS0_9BILA
MSSSHLMSSLFLSLIVLSPKWVAGGEDGFHEIHISDIQVQAMARRGMKRINEMTTHFRYMVPLEILNAKQQTNQFGTETIITLKIQESTCPISIITNDTPHPSCVPYEYGAKEIATLSFSTLPNLNDEMVQIVGVKPC